MLKILSVFFVLIFALNFRAQERSVSETDKPPVSGAAKKANARPGKTKAETFDSVPASELAQKCVKLETEIGLIEMEFFPEAAPATVRNFLNLTAMKAFDTTTFSRVVPNFVVQGGNISTRLQISPELAERMRKTVPDEPSQIRHERGIVSLARSDTPNSGTSHFFILVNEARHLDGTFTAFGRVINGMEIVEAINKMPVSGEKPEKPVRLTKATIFPCPAPKTL